MQFAVNPDNGRMTVIEMNPRVSRSSALASKATGFPIAKIAAKLAVGYTLDEIDNDITRETPACFEPSIDYTVVKVPRWAFEKFRGTDETLTTRMKSVGEAMAIGRTFEEALGKALRSLENGRGGLGADGKDVLRRAQVRRAPRRPQREPPLLRRRGVPPRPQRRRLHEHHAHRPVVPATASSSMVAAESALRGRTLDALTADELREAKRMGLSDVQIAHLTGATEASVRAVRKAARRASRRSSRSTRAPPSSRRSRRTTTRPTRTRTRSRRPTSPRR